jgi:hypothetical protein
VAELREELYESRAFANELARRGFTVLAHDAFLWGSRGFDLAEDHREYDRRAEAHEHVVAKHCVALGTSLAGVVAYEDRVAAAYLRARADVGPWA